MATIGMANAVVLLVAHTVDDGGNIRIISARKATRRERGIYAEGNYKNKK